MIFDVAAEVVANTRLSNDYNIIALAAPDVARAARPGQFVMVKPAAASDLLLRRPFSIFEIVRTNGEVTGLSLLNKRIGIGTGHLYSARVGDRIDCLGPLGQPFAPVQPPAEAWMIAGGVGLAPFVTLTEALATLRTRSTLFYGGRSSVDLFRDELFEQLGARVVVTTEDGTRGERGRVTSPVERALAALRPEQSVTLYACGPTPMMRAVAELGRRFRRATFVSLEPVMGCGMGGCYSCVVPVRQNGASHFVRSCIQGPVFDATCVAWERLTGGH
jgi:dihydroorotate dehydrogenase electron transfer subunit